LSIGSSLTDGADGNEYAAETRTKEYYLQLATQALNESTRLDPASAINTLARGIYSIFKSSTPNTTERNHHLDTASKIFEEVSRQSSNTNMIALLGKARVHFARKRYDKALENYQEVLLRRPDMDPDPRIGIGMCFWCLGHKDDAKAAWERALSIDPDSKVAHILIATYYLDITSKMSEYDPAFMDNYRRVIEHTQKAYKLDKNFPMACTTFASHFFAKKGYAQCETLSKKAIEYSDVASVTCDAWYTLARKAHAENDHERALSYYRKADQAREGGWYPAKIGIGQIQILMKQIPAARVTFEAAVHENQKCLEAKTILGSIYAHEVLSTIPRTGFAGTKDDVTELHKKAIDLLETVRTVWKNEQRIDPAAEGLLLTLARLYENHLPEKSLQCLEAVEQIYVEAKETDPEVTMPIQLLNNMAVLCWHQQKYDKARTLYQQALEKIPELKTSDEKADTDALATTLTYNLGRCEEHYEQLLQFHSDYVDANMRLAYIALRRGAEDGPKKLKKLMETDGTNLEVRALYGWFLGKSRKKPPVNPAEDHEQRHYKHSLQHYDKHDRYSLAGMGNIYLQTAREMRRDTETDKEKRKKTYEKAVEFFDKVLQLDPKNAYAAQGIAIAMIEDRKDMRNAVGILTKVRETLSNDPHAVVNLGHCLAALEQWGRAIENVSSFFPVFILHFHAHFFPSVFFLSLFISISCTISCIAGSYAG
jgi:RNA polymerase-associated protein CTR9